MIQSFNVSRFQGFSNIFDRGSFRTALLATSSRTWRRKCQLMRLLNCVYISNTKSENTGGFTVAVYFSATGELVAIDESACLVNGFCKSPEQRIDETADELLGACRSSSIFYSSADLQKLDTQPDVVISEQRDRTRNRNPRS